MFDIEPLLTRYPYGVKLAMEGKPSAHLEN